MVISKNAFATIPGTSTSFGQPIENKPPYMALYWVMRIKSVPHVKTCGLHKPIRLLTIASA